MPSNDQVERRGFASTVSEADLSQSSPPPWLTEDAARDRSNRLLDYRAAPAPKLPLNSADELTPSLPRRKDHKALSCCGPALNGGCSILRQRQRTMRKAAAQLGPASVRATDTR